MTTQPMPVARWGNSLAVRLPAPLAAQLAVAEGGALTLRARRAVVPPAGPTGGVSSQHAGFGEEEQAPFDAGFALGGVAGDTGDSFQVTVGRWGNSLAVRLPRALAVELGLSEGDRVSFADGGGAMLDVSKELSVDELFARIRALRGLLPADIAFDREEANIRLPQQ